MVRVVRGREIGQGPSKPLRPRGLGQLPCEGSLLRGRSLRGKPPHQGRWPRSRPEGFSPLTGSIAKSRAGHARPLRTAVNGLRTRGAREGSSPPLCSGWRLPENGWQHTARRDPSGLAGSASSPDGEPFCGLSPEIIAAVKNRGGSGEPPNLKWRKGRGR